LNRNAPRPRGDRPAKRDISTRQLRLVRRRLIRYGPRNTRNIQFGYRMATDESVAQPGPDSQPVIVHGVAPKTGDDS
ncbi:MAG: hypothetical protein R6U98_28700, partial [Pirellulaceae bacterium]